MALRTVYEMAFEGYVPVNMQFKQVTVVVPRLQFIDRVGHCRYATVTGFLLVQTVQKTVVIPLCSSLARLFTSRCCATTGTMVRQCCPVELPQLQFIDSRRHSNCGAEVVVVPQVHLRLWTSRDHAATVSSTVEVPQIPFIVLLCIRDGCAAFSSGVMSAMKSRS